MGLQLSDVSTLVEKEEQLSLRLRTAAAPAAILESHGIDVFTYLPREKKVYFFSILFKKVCVLKGRQL